jgi:hypothetical protein
MILSQPFTPVKSFGENGLNIVNSSYVDVQQRGAQLKEGGIIVNSNKLVCFLEYIADFEYTEVSHA